MKNFVLDNSLKNLGKAVLWQYDRAVRLLSIMKHMQVLFFCAIEQFWAKWMERVLSIDTCGEFGCLVWSILLGIPRPTVTDGNGNVRQIVPSVYRRLLKGKYYLSKADASAESILGYLEIVFGIPGRDAYSDWQLTHCEYGWSTNIEELNDLHNNPPRLQYHVYRAYDAGEIFGYVKSIEDAEHGGYKIVSQNYVVQSAITAKETTSWEAISAKVSETEEAADLTHEDEMLLLKLYDPSGICRKIAGAPSDALSISVDYTMGETSVYATIVRHRMCGVAVVDDGDMAMHYAKSPYFGMMHRDQQALFEQRMDDVCPYPLGIKSNEPVEEVVFGFIGQENEQYKTCKEYAVGDVFGYADGEGEAFNWECIEPISAVENISFGAIQRKLRKTNKGDPFVGGLVDYQSPFFGPLNIQATGTVIGESLNYWKSLSRFYPNASETTADIIPIYWIGLDTLQMGRKSGIVAVYKPTIWAESGYTEITDGENYTALFSGNRIENTSCLLLTKSLAQAYPLGKTSYGRLNILNYRATLYSYFNKYGGVDAIGDIAYRLGWQKIGNESANMPIIGVEYQSKTKFEKGHEAFWLDLAPATMTSFPSGWQGEGILRPLARTSFINESTLHRIRQGESTK